MARKITLSRLRRRNRRFYTRYFSALAVFALLVLAACGLIRDMLTAYELAQPDYTANEAARMYLDHDYAAMYAMEDPAYLDGASLEEYTAFMQEHIGDMEITWKKKITADDVNVTYALYADGKRFGGFVLAPSQTEGRYGMTGYTLSSAQTTIFIPTPPVEPVTGTIQIRCDSRSTVMVNGQMLDESAILESGLPTAAQDHMPKGVTAPTDVLYEITVEGEPQISVTDHRGREQTVSLDNGTYVAAICYDDEAVKGSRESWIFQLAQIISRYTTNNASLNTLLSRVEEGSKAHQYLSQYDGTYTKEHYGYDFANMASRHYIIYSDECFSCEVQYEYIVNYYAGNKTYPSSFRFYFRKVNDRWMLYDFETLKYE